MTAGARPAPEKAGFRADVEGLRAVAVVAVLLYHAGVPFAGGGYVGVDVFFVISGFLITGLLLRELERDGEISLLRFYSRRAKRLLPLTVAVLVPVVVLSWVLFDPVRMDAVSVDVISSALYVMNWRLAFDAADYFGAGLQASPVQHFWTLAVEEQFYLLWPPLLLLVAWWCRRSGWGLRPTLATVFGTVIVLSLAYGVYSTMLGAGAAYFSTLTRGWELALGGMLALVPLSRLRPGRAASTLLAVGGLAAIAWSANRFGDDTLFPGVAALIPTLGTAAIIAAGFAPVSGAPSRLLALAPVRHVGRISYSWYLWHWPPLVFAAELWGSLTPTQGMLVLAASYVPAVLTHRLVERPFLHSERLSRHPREALALGGACTFSSVALGLVLFVVTPSLSEPPESKVAGAAALLRGDPPQKTAEAVHPTPREATERRSLMYEDGCHLETPETEPPECVYGNPDSETTVVLFGDSHALHWFPALNRLAERRDWRLVAMSKSACPPAEVGRYEPSLRREYRECNTWRQNALDRIGREKPALVVTSMRNPYRVMEDGKRLDGDASEVALEDGYVKTLQTLRDTGARVAVIEDVPHPRVAVPECVSRSLDDLQECASPKDKALGFPKINGRAAGRVDGVQVIDPTPALCPRSECPAVVGDALVYRNGSHITPTYARTLAPWLGERLPALKPS